MKLLKFGNRAIAVYDKDGNLKLISDKIPMYLSELINDTEYITKFVDDLQNYYDKKQVNDLITNVSHLKLEVVHILPTENINTTTIYLLPNGEDYDEYIYINNKWELIGTTKIDLSNYYTKEELEQILANFKPTGESSPILYTLPLGEASWLRIAKVKDISKIASGIFTFNSYGIKEDGSKDTLNAVTFSVNSGINRVKQVYGDVLPLSVSPEMSGSSSSDGSVDTPSSASVVEEDIPAVASEDEILAVSSDVPSSSVGGSGSGSANSFGLTTVTIEEYDQEIYVCGLVSFPNVEYYKAFEVELILENNSNYEPLEIFEKVDFTMVDSKGQMPVLEGMTLEEGKNYNFILKGKLGTYIENIKNTKPLEINIISGDNGEFDTTLIKYIGSSVKEFQLSNNANTEWYLYKRAEELDTILNDVQYYGYRTDASSSAAGFATKLLVKDDPVIAWETVPYYTDGSQYNGHINYSGAKGYQQKVFEILGKEIYSANDDLYIGFFGNMHNIFYESENTYFDFSGGMNSLDVELFCLLYKNMYSEYWECETIIPEKVPLKISYEFGVNTTSEPFTILLNGEIVNEISETNPEVIINEFVYAKDKLEIYVPDGAYIRGSIFTDISNFDYKVYIPYTPKTTEEIKEYLIAEENPYGISLMVEETVKHNIIDKYNMHSIYKQLEKVEDDVENAKNELYSELDASVSEVEKNMVKVYRHTFIDDYSEYDIYSEIGIAKILTDYIYQLYIRNILAYYEIYSSFYIFLETKKQGNIQGRYAFYFKSLYFNYYGGGYGLFFDCVDILDNNKTYKTNNDNVIWFENIPDENTNFNAFDLEDKYFEIIKGSFDETKFTTKEETQIIRNQMYAGIIYPNGEFYYSLNGDDIQNMIYACFFDFTNIYTSPGRNAKILARCNGQLYIAYLVNWLNEQNFYECSLENLYDGSSYSVLIPYGVTNETANTIQYEKIESNIKFATKEYVDEAIANLSTLNLQVVQTLPTENISTTTIYLVPVSTTETNIYEEYIYVNDKWELIGTTKVDLTDYAKKTELFSKDYNDLINKPTMPSEFITAIPYDDEIGNGLYQLFYYMFTHVDEFYPKYGSSVLQDRNILFNNKIYYASFVDIVNLLPDQTYFSAKAKIVQLKVDEDYTPSVGYSYHSVVSSYTFGWSGSNYPTSIEQLLDNEITEEHFYLDQLADKEYVDEAISNAITKVLNEEV